jgi:non-histone protein 10
MAPQSAPPSLPPSVEEAYRRKCVQLRNRTNEVEDANDAARLRLARIKRQVEKLRIERAFLLEQLAKRTSTNVEDSDGSPSPPPTPKDRPLRTKRGHRKASAVSGDAADADRKASADAPNQPGSPQSESQAHPAESQDKDADAADAENNAESSSKAPASAFDIFCAEVRSKAKAESKDDSKDDEELPAEDELKQAWEELGDDEQAVYKARYKREAAEDEDLQTQEKKKDEPAPSKADALDEDVEMGENDTEDQETQGDKEAGD